MRFYINRNLLISQWNEDPLMNNSQEAKANIIKVKRLLVIKKIDIKNTSKII